MKRFRARLDGTVLALIALATLAFASVGHVHGHPQAKTEAVRLECRLPIDVSSKPQCPSPSPHNHLNCSTCLAANFAGTIPAAAAPQLDRNIVYKPVAFDVEDQKRGPHFAASPFQARGPPRLTSV